MESSPARRQLARVVYADNLYAYGPVDGPLTEDLPASASGPIGRVRAALAAELMEAHARGDVRAAVGRASDFYGPWGRQSTAGERLFVPALRGKATQVLGDPDLPHTFTYLGDFARGLATLGKRDEALGQVWHVPSAETLTTRGFIDLVYEAAGNPSKLSVLPSVLLSLLALMNPTLRAVKEQQAVPAWPKLGRRPHQVRPRVRGGGDSSRRRHRPHARLLALGRARTHACATCPVGPGLRLSAAARGMIWSGRPRPRSALSQQGQAASTSISQGVTGCRHSSSTSPSSATLTRSPRRSRPVCDRTARSESRRSGTRVLTSSPGLTS